MKKMKDKLDNLEVIKQVDRSDMLKIMTSFDRQCQEAVEIASTFKEIEPLKEKMYHLNNIIFTGLGGSAIGADLIKSYLGSEMRFPIWVNRNYTLPGFTTDKTLVFCCSYSGNTEETLQGYIQAKENRAAIVCVTSGGKLKEYADRDGFPCVVIPGGLPPRTALGYSFFVPLVLLTRLGLSPDKKEQIDESIQIIRQLKDQELCPEIELSKNKAKQIALSLYGRFPVIYGADGHTDAVATRWRGQLAENSKTLASSHVFPEMNHNEIVGWEYPQDILKEMYIVLLRDKDDLYRVQKRMEITLGIIKEKAAGAIEVGSQGEGLLARIFSLIYIGDFVSFYLAVLNDVDPTPVDKITYLKECLAKV